MTYAESLRIFRRDLIHDALQINHGRVGKTARDLGLHRNTLARIMREVGLVRCKLDGSLRQPVRRVAPREDWSRRA